MISWKKISLKDLAGYIAEELRKNDIDTVLVGDACVTIYSNNNYQSYDLDFITYEEMKKVNVALQNLGFHKKQKYFQHPDCIWFIEFVTPPVAIGDQPIHEFNQIKTKLGEIKLLKAVDCVKDRLASYYYWNDKQGLEQAINVSIEQNIDVKEVERWSKQEGQIEKFKEFKKLLSEAKRKNNMIVEYIGLAEKVDDGYTVFFPDFPGFGSAGNTLKEARKNAKEGLITHIELLIEHGEQTPKPSSLDRITKSKEAKEYIPLIVSFIAPSEL